jgi:hypothetical protein
MQQCRDPDHTEVTTRNLYVTLWSHRIRLYVTAGQVLLDPRARRRRTLHPDQRALALD